MSSPSSVTEVSHILASASPSAVTEIFTYSYIHALTRLSVPHVAQELPARVLPLPLCLPLLSLLGNLITSLSADHLASQLTERTQTLRSHCVMVSSVRQLGHGAQMFGRIPV